MYTDHRIWYLLRTVTILHVRQCETVCREWNRNKIQHRRLCVWWRLWSVLMGSTVHNPNKCPGSRPRLLQLRAPWQHAACSGGSGDGGSGQCLKSCNKDVWVWQLDHSVLRHTQPVTWAGWPVTTHWLRLLHPKKEQWLWYSVCVESWQKQSCIHIACLWRFVPAVMRMRRVTAQCL